ncbi:hypothetical protein T492DRAFT_1037135 [Pavlovales sp. CCMP2436]|nr:hypothetical protein T492DRAFT_1037135 [Pavlovales sp. CCMP2436]
MAAAACSALWPRAPALGGSCDTPACTTSEARPAADAAAAAVATATACTRCAASEPAPLKAGACAASRGGGRGEASFSFASRRPSGKEARGAPSASAPTTSCARLPLFASAHPALRALAAAARAARLSSSRSEQPSHNRTAGSSGAPSALPGVQLSEQPPQKSCPHSRQWWRRRSSEKAKAQEWHCTHVSSGIQYSRGSSASISPSSRSSSCSESPAGLPRPDSPSSPSPEVE